MGYRVLLLVIFTCFQVSTMVSAEVPLTAAFIRDHQLWIKHGEDEIQVTKGQNVNSPKWSYDGRFIAYIDGDRQGENSQLFIYDTKANESYQPYVSIQTGNFKWSPVKNQIAYTSGGVLNVTKTKDGRPQGFENVSLGVSDFEWFPNGREFIVSAYANLLPTGWGPVQLFKIPIDAHLNTEKARDFYTIQNHTSDIFAISADYFNWSSDGKWVSFLATPTASWSNDSNTLCVLTSQGKQFKKIGNMLGYQDWMKWAPTVNQLAYISGEGRFFVENKKSKIAEMPSSVQQREYTPKGFVDLDLDWFSLDKVIVARAKENKEWKEGPVPTMYTALYVINIKSEEQQQVTFPKKNEFDADPQVVNSQLTWFRKKDKENKGNVWIKDSLSSQENLWLKNVDSAPIFHKRIE